MRALHARLHINSSLCFLHLNSAAIKTENELLVVDGLARAIVELFQSDIDSHIDVFRRFRFGLVEASVCSAKVTSLNLEVGSSDLGQVSAEIEEWI